MCLLPLRAKGLTCKSVAIMCFLQEKSILCFKKFLICEPSFLSLQPFETKLSLSFLALNDSLKTGNPHFANVNEYTCI